jgi:2'-5' RNA ligase
VSRGQDTKPMRLFVAVNLSEEARDAVAAEQKRIAAATSGGKSLLKWVEAEQAHLTLVFLGHVDAALAPAVIAAVARDVDLAPFDMVLGGIGAFPPRGAPRVLWVGVTEGAEEMMLLQRELAARVTALGIPVEDRAFHPHLTIARWRESRPADRDRAIGAGSRGALARVRVAAATLYESKLSPAGPAYTALAHANLTPRI